jgi:hypothetical protein
MGNLRDEVGMVQQITRGRELPIRLLANGEHKSWSHTVQNLKDLRAKNGEIVMETVLPEYVGFARQRTRDDGRLMFRFLEDAGDPVWMKLLDMAQEFMRFFDQQRARTAGV